MFNIAMPPIDPQQLLKALGSLLAPSGGIKGAQEASRIASLMKDATKLVTRCIYLNILRVTESQEALLKFIDVGGWNTLNHWLDFARNDNNDPFLGELLEVYLKMPVTVVLLKQNSAAKTIKQLSKLENEKIKTLSTKLVESWTKTIRGQSNGSELEDEKKKKKKHKEKDKAKEKEKSDKDKENDKKEKDEKDSDRHKSREKDSKEHNKDKDKKDRDRSKDKDRSKRDKSKSSSDSKEVSSKTSSDAQISGKSKDLSNGSSKRLSIDESKTTTSFNATSSTNKTLDTDFFKDEDSKRRPKTVKQLNTKFRSTGLFEEEEESLDQSKKKLEKLGAKRTSLDVKNEDSLDKKPRLNLTMPSLTSSSNDAISTTPPEVTHGRIKLIPPKRAPAHEIQESNVFMDALKSTVTGIKRKKKPLVSPSTTIAPFSMKGTSGTSPPPASSPLATSPPQLSSSTDTDVTSPPILSPTTAMAQKLPSVPSFYRDTLEDVAENTSDKKEAEKDETPPCLESMETNETEQEPDYDNGNISVLAPEELNTTDFTESDVKSTKPKKNKKTVSWAKEQHLEEYFYFELDETERENVNKPKTFNEMKKEEMMLDRRAMESAKRFNNDTMVEVLQWKRPKPIDNVIVVVESGCNSKERKVQTEREQIVLCALFFNKVPDTPVEPDLEISGDKIETQIIPLEDENGSCTEYEHTYNFNDPSSLPYDPEFGGLPLQNQGPSLNNQVGPMGLMPPNIIGGNMNPNMGMNAVGNMNIPPAISHILTTLQQQAQETRDPVMQNLQGMLTNVLQNTNPQDSGMLMERILNALEPFKNQIPGLSNLINSVIGNGIDHNGPRFMGPNQMGNPRHGLLGSAPPGFNMMGGGGGGGGGMRPNMGPGPANIMNNKGGGMGGGGGNFFMGGGVGAGGNMRMPGPGPQWSRGRGRPFGKRGGIRNVVCQFYVKKGNCKFGDVCQFIHPGPNS